MEKKHRDIVVDDIKYAWTIIRGGKEQYVQVWKDGKQYFSENFRLSSVTPADISDAIKDYNERLRQIEVRETLDVEWSAFMATVPWDGYGSTIAESSIIFASKRRKWMQKMAKKHGCSMSLLLLRYKHD